jgi:hypothetical protein
MTRKLHVSDVLYIIYINVGRTFSFNDVNHLLTKGQVSAMLSRGCITKTESTVKSQSLTKPNSDIPVWVINEYGMRVMKRYCNVNIMPTIKTTIKHTDHIEHDELILESIK